MNNIEVAHPSSILKPEWTRLIREHAQHAEALGSLTQAQLELIYEQGWFKLFVPEQLGGMDMDLPDGIRLEEALAWADGSIGWTVTLCGGAGWFAGFMDSGLAGQIMSETRFCIGGSGAVTGVAVVEGSGYRISGQWNYASGAAHLSHFTANCRIMQGAKPVLDKTGLPLILPFAFERSEVELIQSWKTMGLVATGSQSFAVNDLFVLSNRSFLIDAGQAKIGAAIYQYPFLQLAQTTIAANISGMAMHFTDLCDRLFSELIAENKLPLAHAEELTSQLQGTTNTLTMLRSSFYAMLEKSWQACVQHGNQIPDELLREVSEVSLTLARSARAAIDELYPYCGLRAADPSSDLNRVWRDLHTASQHALLRWKAV